MEDFDKYVFDPKNPRGFKAYDLLLKIISDKDNVVILDTDFFIEIFHKEIFDKETEKEIWDKPDNFRSLSAFEKAEIYVENFSKRDLGKLVLKKLPKIKSKNSIKLFPEFISSYSIRSSTSKNYLTIAKSNTIDDEYISTYFLEDALEFVLEREIKKSKIDKNLIFFLNGENILLAEKFYIERASILFVSYSLAVSHYQEIIENNKNLRPIILKKDSDIHTLLDYLNRDIQKIESKKKIADSTDFHELDKTFIQNYFSLHNIQLTNLQNKKEIYFLGENGDGKTLLLQSILLSLKGNKNIGLVSDFLKQNDKEKLKLEATDSKGNKYGFSENPKSKKGSYEHIFAYGVNRFRNDSDKKDKHGFLTLFSHEEYLENPLKWLQHLDYKKAKGERPEIPLEIAKDLLRELLEKNVEIEVTPDGVIFNERGTELQFEQLSDGYKSVIVWVCDLLARLSSSQPNVEQLIDYQGIVMVDEIGMFLHPKWQRSIVGKLRNWFPNIQFIFTTHSPIVVLGASCDAVFYKVYKEDGVTKISDPIENESLAHLMANSIITAPFLFNLKSAKTAAFDENKEELDTSDDYISGKIHEAISQRLEKNYNISEEEIFSVVEEELTKYESQTKNDKN